MNRSTPAGILLVGLLLAAGRSPGMEPETDRTPQQEDSTELRCTAVMDTVRIVPQVPPVHTLRGLPLHGPACPEACAGELRDPAQEPLFVTYARPAQLMGLGDRLDLDRVRWRYHAPDESR